MLARINATHSQQWLHKHQQSYSRWPNCILRKCFVDIWYVFFLLVLDEVSGSFFMSILACRIHNYALTLCFVCFFFLCQCLYVFLVYAYRCVSSFYCLIMSLLCALCVFRLCWLCFQLFLWILQVKLFFTIRYFHTYPQSVHIEHPTSRIVQRNRRRNKNKKKKKTWTDLGVE